MTKYNNKLLEKAEPICYKKVGGKPLNVWLYKPEKAQAPMPTIIFFHGGLWDVQVISQFVPQCMHFAQKGFLSGVAEYRIKEGNEFSPLDSMRDARSLVRWLRYNSEFLGIDKDKIILGGASSGAFIAFSTSIADENLNEPSEDGEIPCGANALVMFEPITDTTKRGVAEDIFPDKGLAKKLSPVNNILRKKMPPTIVIHGKTNRVVPFENSHRFVRTMRRKKNLCEFYEFENKGSGFFNFNVSSEMYEITLAQIGNFLIELGYLDASEAEELSLL